MYLIEGEGCVSLQKEEVRSSWGMGADIDISMNTDQIHPTVTESVPLCFLYADWDAVPVH